MESDDLLCSRNARPQKALVGRAQWKINEPPSLREEQLEQTWRGALVCCRHLPKYTCSTYICSPIAH